MAQLVIRILPTEPVSAADFTAALNGLKIEAFDLSFANLDGTSLGSASYLPPTSFPPSPGPNPTPTQDPNTRIVQHFRINPNSPFNPNDQTLEFFAVATAVIDIPVGTEYKTADVILKITSGTREIIHKQKYFNVPVKAGGMPALGAFQGLSETSLHLQIPISGQSLNPLDAFVDVPIDGTPPNFEQLKIAIAKVLAKDPSGAPAISALTPKQARHIAYEIVWNRDIYPLPITPRNLEEMYTGPQSDGDADEQDRKKFEGVLLTYYSKHNAEAEHLSNFVYSVATALKCEEISGQVQKIGFNFFTRPDSPVNEALIRNATILIKNKAGGAVTPSFKVDARFFYAISSIMNNQINAEQRYQMATMGSEMQLATEIERARENGVIDYTGTVNNFQAARLLIALGLGNTLKTNECGVVTGDNIHTLLVAWQTFSNEKIEDFWAGFNGWPQARKDGHYDLVLSALSEDSVTLIVAIKAALATDITQLALKIEGEWRTFFLTNPALLPEYTKPGTTDERIRAFVRYLTKFFDVSKVVAPAPPPQASAAPLLDRPSNLLDTLIENGLYSWSEDELNQALDAILPEDEQAKADLKGLLTCIKRMIALTDGISSAPLRFSVIEALWARGFTNAATFKGLSKEDLRDALTGSVAYDHTDIVWTNAGQINPPVTTKKEDFVPINADGNLVNCIPPLHLSPLGPVAYLKDLLDVSAVSTCENPKPRGGTTLAELLRTRRGDLSSLLVTDANLSVPIPLMDIANESLEFMVANSVTNGKVYNTSTTNVAAHELTSHPSPTDGVFLHDPETLLGALPEHSTPHTPVAAPNAYAILEGDFSTPDLPYSQAMDINCSYLRQMKTSRYDTVRRFRKEITEFVIDPTAETPEFQKHLWRYPVRLEAAISYFCLSQKEFEFFTGKAPVTIPSVPNQRLRRASVLAQPAAPKGKLLHKLYGFIDPSIKQPDGTNTDWKETVVEVPEFLDRTGLSYCEFIELWRSRFVKFRNKGGQIVFADCEPCCLDKYTIEFEDPSNPEEALNKLSVFIRLWKKLRAYPNTAYTFEQLGDICTVLKLFNGSTVNPDFLRQLLAFQMLRDDFKLSLTDGTPPAAGATGADRLHLLSFWFDGAAKFDWAVQHLLNQIQQYAQRIMGCGCREPEFIKLLQANLEPLSLLAGFEPSHVAANAHWHQQPTKTLRFAEILAKIYASEFTVGEILFLFTADLKLQGDDPFPHQTDNEAKDSPFGLPDDDDPNALWALRRKILDVKDPKEEEVHEWTWLRIGTALENDFGYSGNEFNVLGLHFFPNTLIESGIDVSRLDQQYRAPLALAAPTSAAMWNTPNGPFHYENGELWTTIPLTDEDVIEKLSRIRQLNATEQQAVQNLYFMPRLELARFSLVFTNFKEAEEALIQEADEEKRWAWFQKQFVMFYKRCQVIAEHLATHVVSATNQTNAEIVALSKMILKNLLADENKAITPWENDNGSAPAVNWNQRPNGSAFAALLGLAGTGMLAKYKVGNVPRWEEVIGGVTAFGTEENAWNAPIPTILPGFNFALLAAQQPLSKFVNIRNGFALTNPTGTEIGGAEPFLLTWDGLLLIKQDGLYSFQAGSPTPDGEAPDFEKAAHVHHWRVELKRGQKTWILLSHEWPNEEAPGDCSKSINLKKGIYNLNINLERQGLDFDDIEDVGVQTTGFQLKYNGPDSNQLPIAIPNDKLFMASKNSVPNGGIVGQFGINGTTAGQFLDTHYVSTVRDIRRTYQRAYKALLFAHRFRLSANLVSDGGQSELEYMLTNSANFSGQSYYHNGGGFTTHKADFNFNFLPVLDNYFAPLNADDQRGNPSAQRTQALFDWWERMFDYTTMRREAQVTPENPVWLLFHESKENHPDIPLYLLRYMGIDLTHEKIVQKYYLGYDIASADLEDDRWAVRVWKAEQWIRKLRYNVAVKDIRMARPDLWASVDPNTELGNQNLTQFYRDSQIENREPRRYENIKKLNDGLRLRGHKALVSYLCTMNRTEFPWELGSFATKPKHLSEVLLLDVETGLCQKASRIEEAITVVQLFVQRARLGLEPTFIVTPAFLLAWERHFDTYRIWEACKRRKIYRENWIDLDEMAIAERSETYQFLKSELRSATLTMPIPGGVAHWSGARPPMHPNITLLQHRKSSTIGLLNPAPEGLGLMGTEDRHARPNWLAPMRGATYEHEPPKYPNEPVVDFTHHVTNRYESTTHTHQRDTIDNDSSTTPLTTINADLPLWLQAAVRLGTKFVRVAAAGIPPATTTMGANCQSEEDGSCCVDCEAVKPTLIDEYYFWIEESAYYDEQEQIAEWGADAKDPQTDWHRPEKLPSLLHWKSKKMVHLHWSRVHNGEFQQPRKSYEGVWIDSSKRLPPEQEELVLMGRIGDSLHFEYKKGKTPEGYLGTPGFRYDIATDEAIVLPEVVTSDSQPIGGLPSFPYFAWYSPGVPLLPPSMFSPAVSVAGHLRAHCQFEAALKWYELVYNPLKKDNTWVICQPKNEEDKEGEKDKEVKINKLLNILDSIRATDYELRKKKLVQGNSTKTCCCASEEVSPEEAKERSILMHYVETLLQWGDALMRKNTPESFQKARLIFDTASKIVGATPATIKGVDTTDGKMTVQSFTPECAPLNARLLCIYMSVSDRLALIHHCLNAKRLKNGRPNLDMPYFGDSTIRECWKTTDQTCLDDNDWCMPQSSYRFAFLIQQSENLAGEVRGLGVALLAAYEKGDGEYLANMRAMHERQLLHLSLEVRQNQWREADWQVQALKKTKEIAQTRLQYYQMLIANGLIAGEAQYEPLTISSTVSRSAGNVAEGIGQMMNLIPDPYVGFPANFVKLPPGSKMAAMFSAAGKIANVIADILNTNASLGLTKAGWERREQEWNHQVDVLTIEIEQIERQILSSERRRDIALRELNNHQQQIENAEEVHDFLRDKFTNHALYLWMQQETAAMYYQIYELALHCARQTQRAFNFERGHLTRNYIPAEIWNNLHEGLLSGERLQLALKQMEKAYYDENVREYELTKHISLRIHQPMQLMLLRETGYCEIELPEWLFDLDYPGHYMRRIKNVTLTLPCVVGPYTGVHCRLTLLSSKTRVNPRLNNNVVHCCEDSVCDSGYETMPDDPRMVAQYAATEAIATSTGQNDSGLFELNFRDERYLPFEYAGAVSRWRIELPKDNNYFDLNTLSDAILHVNYMAREGGELLRKAANKCAQKHLPGDGMRFFDVKQEMPDAWYLFKANIAKVKNLTVSINRQMFPYLPSSRQIWLNGLQILFLLDDPNAADCITVQFKLDPKLGKLIEDEFDKDIFEIQCVRSDSMPTLYHGVFSDADNFELGPIIQENVIIGQLMFTNKIECIERMFLIASYKI